MNPFYASHRRQSFTMVSVNLVELINIVFALELPNRLMEGTLVIFNTFIKEYKHLYNSVNTIISIKE